MCKSGIIYKLGKYMAGMDPTDRVILHRSLGAAFLRINTSISKTKSGGAWVALSVKCLTSAQVMISRFMSLSPTSGSVLTAQSLEPASDSVFPSLSLPVPCSLSVCLSLTQKTNHNKH